MNEKIMNKLGFNKEVENVKQNKCPFCGSTKTKRSDFKDDLSWKEYKISGICQKCQDEIF